MNDTSQEREWAQSHFREYLLHRLAEEDEDRVLSAVASIPGLAYDLEDAEEQLIGTWLDQKLPAADREDFDRYYLNGSERNRAKIGIHRALRSPELQREFRDARPAAAPIPFPRRQPPVWAIGAIAALIPVLILGWMLYNQSRRISRLVEEVAKAKKQPNVAPAPVPRNPPEAPRQSPQQPKTPPPPEEEQLAGPAPGGGTILSASDSGKRLAVSAVPTRIVWTPVPDYRRQYRIRVKSRDGGEQTSALLTPSGNAVEYSSDDLANLPLPWEVTVLEAEPDDGVTRNLAPDRNVAHYTLTSPNQKR